MLLRTKLSILIGFVTAVGVIFLLTAGESATHWVLAGLLAALGALVIVLARRSLLPLADVTRVLEGIADGNLSQGRVAAGGGDDEIGRLATATNRMLSQLSAMEERARELAAGRIGVLEVEEQVLRSERLSDADVDAKPNAGDLERSFIALTNQLRRLTIQARVVGRDRLDSPLLDERERVPGELGDAFGLMVRNLRAINERAKDIARGDLTSHVEGDGELTTAFNHMVEGLKGLVEEITQTALHISTAAEQILAVLRDQELAATHQASSVDETQRTMETLLSSAKKIAESAQTVFKSAEKTQENNRTIGERIGELKTHTERIAEILEVIKSIADRSDLLALNASLEGMRAGEAGKGFTLVAAEMRRLAENIKESIGDIKELVSDIRESSMASAMATDEGTRLSEKTTDSALKITLITQQQQSGTEQVTASMEDLSQLINQDVAGTRQVTTAASDLVELSENLRTLVDEFRIGPGAVSAAAAEYAQAAKGRAAQSGSFRRPASGQFRAPAGLASLSSSAVDDDDGAPSASRGAQRRTSRFASAEEPPTVELAGLSPAEQRQAMRDLMAEMGEVGDDASEPGAVDDQIASLERELEAKSAGDVRSEPQATGAKPSSDADAT